MRCTDRCQSLFLKNTYYKIILRFQHLFYFRLFKSGGAVRITFQPLHYLARFLSATAHHRHGLPVYLWLMKQWRFVLQIPPLSHLLFWFTMCSYCYGGIKMCGRLWLLLSVTLLFFWILQAVDLWWRVFICYYIIFHFCGPCCLTQGCLLQCVYRMSPDMLSRCLNK